MLLQIGVTKKKTKQETETGNGNSTEFFHQIQNQPFQLFSAAFQTKICIHHSLLLLSFIPFWHKHYCIWIKFVLDAARSLSTHNYSTDTGSWVCMRVCWCQIMQRNPFNVLIWFEFPFTVCCCCLESVFPVVYCMMSIHCSDTFLRCWFFFRLSRRSISWHATHCRTEPYCEPSAHSRAQAHWEFFNDTLTKRFHWQKQAAETGRKTSKQPHVNVHSFADIDSKQYGRTDRSAHSTKATESSNSAISIAKLKKRIVSTNSELYPEQYRQYQLQINKEKKVKFQQISARKVFIQIEFWINFGANYKLKILVKKFTKFGWLWEHCSSGSTFFHIDLIEFDFFDESNRLICALNFCVLAIDFPK